MAFAGKPTPDQEANHKNGNKADNRLEKLEWVSKSENELHKFRVLGAPTLKGELNGQAKLKDKDIPVIRRLLAEGRFTQREIATLFSVSRQTITSISTRQGWTHI
jgi:DNA-binding MarR family transcriptional regulator